MVDKLSWIKIISISIGAQIVSYIVFLMLQVVWADLLKDQLTAYSVDDVYFIPLLILLFGLFVNILVNMIIYTIFIDYDNLIEFMISIFAFSLTFVTIIFISYFVIERTYPEVFVDFSLFEKVILFPQYIVFFSIYYLESPIFLWDINSIIFCIYMIGLMRLFIKEKPRSAKKIESAYSVI